MKIILDKEYNINEINNIINKNITELIKMFGELKDLHNKEMKKYI